MPLRVLDVSDTENGCVFLRETRDEVLRFVALSYCWGTTDFLTTTSYNLGQHLQSINTSNFPLTIRDAISTTQRLGLHYIWIDALCIVQDNLIEQQLEISRMKDFYRSAYVTISAASTTCCNDGFLQTRQRYEDTIEIAIACPDEQKGHLQLVRVFHEPHPRMMMCPGCEPINERAWTEQESLLSSRILIYARIQLFWLCRQTFESDGGNMTWQQFKNHAAWQKLDLDGIDSGRVRDEAGKRRHPILVSDSNFFLTDFPRRCLELLSFCMDLARL